jgi:hypothetical protein
MRSRCRRLTPSERQASAQADDELAAAASDLNGHLVSPDDVTLPVVLGLDARNCYLAHYPFSRLFAVCKCNSETSCAVSP